MISSTIPTYVINLKHRTDRKEYILQQFAGRPEFHVQIVEACQHEIAPIGLWNSIRKIISIAKQSSEDFIIIAEDDHQFTADYSPEKLFSAIEDAQKLKAHVLCGGVSWFTGTIGCTKNIFWMEMFSGTQFLIIFKAFFDLILNADFTANDDADYKICSLTESRFFICPFISIQKDFGYSDVTEKNNKEGRVEALFQSSSNGIQMLQSLLEYYNKADSLFKKELADYDLDSLKIPTYVINLPERSERRKHIEEQFKGREEFDVNIVSACRHETGALGLWLSVRKVIETAITNDDDVIIICEDDHEFTEHYSREMLLKNIIMAHYQNIDYMSGGSGKFGIALPVSKNRMWTNFCYSTQFIIIFKKFFKAIIDEPFDETIIGDMKLSDMTVNKMILCPFVSRQKDFGYSDVTPEHNENSGMVDSLFEYSSGRVNHIHQNYVRLLENSIL